MAQAECDRFILLPLADQHPLLGRAELGPRRRGALDSLSFSLQFVTFPVMTFLPHLRVLPRSEP